MSCRMVYMGEKDAQKTTRNLILREITSTSDRTAFRKFWGTTATATEIINHELDEYIGLVAYYFNQNTNTD